MCLVLEKGFQDKRIAGNDIEVFKVCELYKNGKIHSYYKHSVVWNVGETKRRVICQCHTPSIRSREKICIGRGLHSYAVDKIVLKLADGHLHIGGEFYYPRNLIRLNCVIPKGADYYCDGNGTYVSSSLKVIGFERFLSKK